MNSHQRHQQRRFQKFVMLGRGAGADRERADRAEVEAAHLRGRVAELGSARDAARSAFATLKETLERDIIVLGGELCRVALDAATGLAERDALAARVGELEREVTELRVEDRDAGKLRRRLRERVFELEAAHARIAVLERAARPVTVDGTVAFHAEKAD